MGELPQAPPYWPIQEPELFVGYLGRLFIVMIGKNCPHERMLAVVDELGKGVDARRETDQIVAMYHVPGEIRSDLMLIKRLSDVVKHRQTKLRQTTLALALTTHSGVARASFRTLLTFTGLPYPYAVVDTPQAALVYLKRHLPSLDVEARLREYEEIMARSTGAQR